MCVVLLLFFVQVREMVLLRQLNQTMRQASAAGGFFDAWMKQNSDLVQGAANAFAGGAVATCKMCCTKTCIASAACQHTHACTAS
jgi:hypothetical protein